MKDKKFAWLLDEEYVPENVTVHTNNRELTAEQFDDAQLKSCGYEPGQTVSYSVKHGKTTLLGNPFMMEGI